jgi:hypothetical protein
MSKCTSRNAKFLKDLATAHHQKRKKIINSCSDDNINALSEIAYNTLRGNLKLTPLQLKKLKKHRVQVRKLAQKSLSAIRKRKLLHQQGGFLPFLLTPFLSALGSIAGKIISNSLG